MENAKVRINVQTGEIEFEGTDTFVTEQMNNLENTVDIIAQLLFQDEDEYEYEDFEETDIIEDEEPNRLSTVEENNLETPGTFGEWLHLFKGNLSPSDKALLTAYFVQKQSQNNDFKTKNVTDALKEHGIKLTNPSRLLIGLQTKKYTFQTRKVGKIIFQRVSVDGGVEHLKTLLR